MSVLRIFLLFGFLSITSNNIFADDILQDGKRFPSLLGKTTVNNLAERHVDSVYNALHLISYGLKKEVFFTAYKGYQYLLANKKLAKTQLLTICDYSQPSTAKRLYVLDVENGEILYHTLVSHGKKSGQTYATTFSNLNSSHKSSLGFMVTADTYFGKAGYSMHFDGMEMGFNDQVRNRAIVMHGSYYVNENRADEGEQMGRSYGCPAIPYALHSSIINTIKGGSCFFAYHPTHTYLQRSKIINAKFSWPAITQNDAENLMDKSVSAK